jgi:uncharacterized membrane protein YkoI
MKASRLVWTVAALAALVLTASDAAAKSLKGEKLQALAKISLPTARAAALKVRPGKVVDEELEKEKGGSGLRYSFDIKVDKVIYEVGVDAATGAVLENAKEGKHPD